MGVEYHSDQSEGQMSPTLQAIQRACKGPVFSRDCKGRGSEGVEEETALSVPSTPFICPYQVVSTTWSLCS